MKITITRKQLELVGVRFDSTAVLPETITLDLPDDAVVEKICPMCNRPDRDIEFVGHICQKPYKSPELPELPEEVVQFNYLNGTEGQEFRHTEIAINKNRKAINQLRNVVEYLLKTHK